MLSDIRAGRCNFFKLRQRPAQWVTRQQPLQPVALGEYQQAAEPARQVVSPAFERPCVKFFPHLLGAGGSDSTLILVEGEAALIEWKAAEIQHAALDGIYIDRREFRFYPFLE